MEDLNRLFYKEGIQMAKKYMERYSTPLIIRERNPVYNEVSPHTDQNGHYQKNLQTINAGEGERKKRNPLTLLVGM